VARVGAWGSRASPGTRRLWASGPAGAGRLLSSLGGRGEGGQPGRGYGSRLVGCDQVLGTADLEGAHGRGQRDRPVHSEVLDADVRGVAARDAVTAGVGASSDRGGVDRPGGERHRRVGDNIAHDMGQVGGRGQHRREGSGHRAQVDAGCDDLRGGGGGAVDGDLPQGCTDLGGGLGQDGRVRARGMRGELGPGPAAGTPCRAGQVQGLVESGVVLEGVDGAGMGGCGQEHGRVAQQQLLGPGDQAQVSCGGVGHNRAVGVHVPRCDRGRNPRTIRLMSVLTSQRRGKGTRDVGACDPLHGIQAAQDGPGGAEAPRGGDPAPRCHGGFNRAGVRQHSQAHPVGGDVQRVYDPGA